MTDAEPMQKLGQFSGDSPVTPEGFRGVNPAFRLVPNQTRYQAALRPAATEASDMPYEVPNRQAIGGHAGRYMPGPLWERTRGRESE